MPPLGLLPTGLRRWIQTRPKKRDGCKRSGCLDFKTFVNQLTVHQGAAVQGREEGDRVQRREGRCGGLHLRGSLRRARRQRGQAIFESICNHCVIHDIKFGLNSTATIIPSTRVVSYALANLPEASPLHGFILDLLRYTWYIYIYDEAIFNTITELFPPTVLVQLLVRST